jgi:hypothetical protein
MSIVKWRVLASLCIWSSGPGQWRTPEGARRPRNPHTIRPGPADRCARVFKDSPGTTGLSTTSVANHRLLHSWFNLAAIYSCERAWTRLLTLYTSACRTDRPSRLQPTENQVWGHEIRRLSFTVYGRSRLSMYMDTADVC